MKFSITIAIILLVSNPFFTNSQDIIDLSGTWLVELMNLQEPNYPHQGISKFKGPIKLPGSLAENEFGFKTKDSDYGILTPEYKYIGKARYRKKISIPREWHNKNIILFLERVLWESRVYIDGIEMSRQDALGTPHIHLLGQLTPGEHELVIQVNNEMIHNIGDKGHAYGAYTQSIWNGVVGEIKLVAKGNISFKETQISSNIENNTLTLSGAIQSKRKEKVEISYDVSTLHDNTSILSGFFTQKVTPGLNSFKKSFSTQGKIEKWSEFNPEVYVIRLRLKSGRESDLKEIEFGFREISHDGTKILINDKPVFLRGNLDCIHFPLTGYPSCDLNDWMEIFKTYKAYGFNHARFHSWCPPEAAFRAANRIGIYLQAEASVWIDGWMENDWIERGRPEHETKGHPKGLGLDSVRDEFIVDEMNRLLTHYGNHPSFTMFCIGNELGSTDYDIAKQWVADLKSRDPNRLYSVSTARTITDVDDYSATHYIRDIGRTRGLNGPTTNWNFENSYSQMNIPIIAHEIGQWPVYPRWSEIDKYTGVLKARNLKELRDLALKNGIEWQSDALAEASGALNQIMYKYEIESFLRTPSCAGIQLLSMQDYQGQGEALIGWLDSHWDSKNITNPEKFRMHHNNTVPLLLLDKFIWKNNETFTSRLQLSHHGESDLYADILWKIYDINGTVLKDGYFKDKHFKMGSLTDLGEISFSLEKIKKAKKLIFHVEVEGTEYNNEWPIWVYPNTLEQIEKNDVIISDEFDSKTLKQLESGAKVLLDAHNLGTEKSSVTANFYPLYWSLTFFPGQGKTNIGLLVDAEHPTFNSFPTDKHSNWQWESISENARGFILNDFPAESTPITQLVDDFHRSNKIGTILELKVGNGKLLVCGYEINSLNPVAKQLKRSLIQYMNSDAFNPKLEMPVEWLTETFKYIPKAEKVTLPEKFENAIFIIDVAKKLSVEKESIKWKAEHDQIELSENVTYKTTGVTSWKENTQTVWAGKQMEIEIDCPPGILGTLLVSFNDYNNQKRTGILNFEGRESKLLNHEGNEHWIRFNIMREDSNDGKILLKTKVKTGGNLMINKIVLLKEG